jgi:hypothetical protein
MGHIGESQVTPARAAARYTSTHGSRTRGYQAWRVVTGQHTRLLLLARVRDGSSKMLS